MKRGANLFTRFQFAPRSAARHLLKLKGNGAWSYARTRESLCRTETEAHFWAKVWDQLDDLKRAAPATREEVSPLDQLKQWRRETFAERTRLLNAGQGRIDWLDEGTRVSWTEVVAKAEKLGVTLHPVELRLAMGDGSDLSVKS